tara:strand:+ start:2940 stop:3635 length:696 start_codon:yes stop_codon:yes gene_type:complete
MLKKFKILIIFLLIFSAYTTKSFSRVGTGEATQYEVTVYKIWLCESGSTESSCSNKVLISNGTKTMDIASVSAGASAGSMGSLSKGKFDKTYTYIQVEMDRAMTITGNDGDCVTSGNGSLTAFAAGKASGNSAASAKLYVPGSDTQGATLSNKINGYRSSDGRISSATTIEDDDDYFWYRQVITGGLTLKQGIIPTLKIAFDVSNAVEGSHNTCTNAHMMAGEPTVSLSFE